jgi:hypothetical protein
MVELTDDERAQIKELGKFVISGSRKYKKLHMAFIYQEKKGGEIKCCAQGAAYLEAGLQQSEDVNEDNLWVEYTLPKKYPVLKKQGQWDLPIKVDSPWSIVEYRHTLQGLIYALNDSSPWSLEQIGDYLLELSERR